MDPGQPRPVIPPSARRRAAVLGHPVGHSLSPVLHRAAYDALGLRGWTYEAVDVDEPELPGFLASLGAHPERGGWAGLSLTMPLKRAVRPLLVRESELATMVGAVNTVTFTGDGPVGDNTDVYGIVAALGGAGVVRASRAVVLGGGATAASTLAALAQLGCSDVSVLVREPRRAAGLLEAADRLGVEPRLEPLDPSVLGTVAAAADVVVSTLPAGAADLLVRDPAAVPRGADGVAPVLLDVVYAPWPTALALAWREAGGVVVRGFAMLLHQAAEQVRLMTGRPGPVEAMRAAGEAELSARSALA